MIFKKYSSEQLARLIGSAFIILGFFGFNSEVDAQALTGAINAIYINGALIIGFLTNVYGWLRRHSKGDVTIGGFRK